MSAAPIRFFLDENLPIVVADQLQRRGIDAVTVRDLNLLGQSDIDHLELARQTGRVLCTHDADYLELARKKGYSMFHLLSEPEYQTGLHSLEIALQQGPVKAESAGETLVWFVKGS